MTPDPYGGSAQLGAPQSWNRYAYANGDPIGAIDPSGQSVIDCIWTGGCLNLSGGGFAGADNGGGGGYYSGSYGATQGPTIGGPLAGLGQTSETQYAANLQQTYAAIQVANLANQYVSHGNLLAASIIASTNQNVTAVPQAPTTSGSIYNAFAGLASSLGIDAGQSIKVSYQQVGVSVSVQAINPTTDAAYQTGDLSFNPNDIGTSDPISGIFHGSGNPSWYIGPDTNALHVVDMQNPPPSQTIFQPGLQWHIDSYNPTSSFAASLLHFATEVIPGIKTPGQPGIVYCQLYVGCNP